jgi:chemotaxis signal transduction protein
VVRPGNLLPVPKSPGDVLGIFGFRDGMATLLSLPALIGLPDAPPAAGDGIHAILLRNGDEASAVQASEILGMAVLEDEEEIEPLTISSLRGLAGRTREGDYVLDAGRLLDSLPASEHHQES